jgi:hypothetical protein
MKIVGVSEQKNSYNRRLAKCKQTLLLVLLLLIYSDHTCFSYGDSKRMLFLWRDTKLTQHIVNKFFLHFASRLLYLYITSF